MSVGYEAIVGLEIHVQLRTQSKMFCGCKNIYGAPPNSHTCPVCLGLPGALPSVNREAVRMAIRLGNALGATLQPRSLFYRKQYFYPDLPKGFQITQGPVAIVEAGSIEIPADPKVRSTPTVAVGIERAHLEEDSGKSTHSEALQASLVDLNRAGVPLLEIVSAPDLRSGQEASDYLKTMHQLVTFLGICDGNMEEGSFRCDANVSVRPQGTSAYGVRVEVKNLNSFKFVKQAIEYEIKRQTESCEAGKTLTQETRGWDSDKSITVSQRTKEAAVDYRYFPEPDLLPLCISKEDIAEALQNQEELPQARAQRYVASLGLSVYESDMLVSSKDFSLYFEALLQMGASAKSASTWILGELSREINTRGGTLADLNLAPERLASLIKLVDANTVSRTSAKDVILPLLLTSNDMPEIIVQREGLAQVSDPVVIRQMVQEVLDASPQQLEQYRSGKTNLKGYFVGQVMKRGKGQINAQIATEELDRLLN